MYQLTCILEGDYKALVVLLAALERIGQPICYSSYADLANQCTDLVDWPVEPDSLRKRIIAKLRFANLRMRKTVKIPLYKRVSFPKFSRQFFNKFPKKVDIFLDK